MILQYKEKETSLNEVKRIEKCMLFTDDKEIVIETTLKDGHIKAIIIKEKSYD